VSGSGWWVGWYNDLDIETFELHSPWWVSGEDMDGNETMVAAVRAEDETAARQQILDAYDNPPRSARWRFCEPIPEGKSPFSDRFQQNEWMAWDEQGTCMCPKHGGPR
jgi:hypothetical protein